MEALQSLVIAAQNGDLDAFGHIVQRFQGMAYTSAYAMLDDAQLAEDVAQEAFIEAYLNLPKLREPAAFPGWFRRIVFKQGDRVLRGKHLATVPLEPVSTFDLAVDDLNPLQLAENFEMQDFVRGAIEALPEHERIVTLLFYVDGYTLKDIAAFLEIPVTTVKKRLYDARRRLKERLMKEVRVTVRGQQLRSGHYPDKIRLFIAIRRGDFEAVRAQIERDPTLVTMKMAWDKQATLRYQVVIPVGDTALHEAAGKGHVAIADLLIDYGANIDARTRSSMTPMHNAILGHHTDVVKLLVARGANVDAALANGLTPLHQAAMKGFTDIAEILLEMEAQVNAQSQAGRTPLHWAAINGHVEIVRLLLEKGANADLQDELGRTPLDWALTREQSDVVPFLQQYNGLSILPGDEEDDPTPGAHCLPPRQDCSGPYAPPIIIRKDAEPSPFFRKGNIMNNDRMIFDVEHLLGRIINSQGESIDERGPISSAARLPLYDFAASETEAQGLPVSMIEMGIKVVDLLAPVPRGGIFAMHSMPGLGKLVVQQEMIHNLITHHDSYVVGIGMDESAYDASELVAPLEDFPDKNRMVLVFEQMSDSQEVLQRLIRVGLTIAIELRQQGHEVMFIVDKNIVAKTDPSTFNALKRVIQEQGLITLLLTPEEDGVQRDEENDVRNVLDTRIFFSRELAKQDIWPAIDRMASHSRLLVSDAVSDEHRRIAQQVRELLQRYASSQDTSAKDQQMVKRARRVQFFLTQPFFVAEAFTDIPGEFVPLAETLKGCKELLEGRYDDLPEQAFYFVGTIEQALAKAKVLGG